MRNTNTSFIENAICRFANEAVQVLRAVTDPAISLVRLFSTAVRALLGYGLPNPRQRRLLVSETSADVTMLPGHINPMPGKFVGTFGGRGLDAWSGLLGQTVS